MQVEGDLDQPAVGRRACTPARYESQARKSATKPRARPRADGARAARRRPSAASTNTAAKRRATSIWSRASTSRPFIASGRSGTGAGARSSTRRDRRHAAAIFGGAQHVAERRRHQPARAMPEIPGAVPRAGLHALEGGGIGWPSPSWRKASTSACAVWPGAPSPRCERARARESRPNSPEQAHQRDLQRMDDRGPAPAGRRRAGSSPAPGSLAAAISLALSGAEPGAPLASSAAIRPNAPGAAAGRSARGADRLLQGRCSTNPSSFIGDRSACRTSFWPG